MSLYELDIGFSKGRKLGNGNFKARACPIERLDSKRVSGPVTVRQITPVEKERLDKLLGPVKTKSRKPFVAVLRKGKLP